MKGEQLRTPVKICAQAFSCMQAIGRATFWLNICVFTVSRMECCIAEPGRDFTRAFLSVVQSSSALSVPTPHKFKTRPAIREHDRIRMHI